MPKKILIIRSSSLGDLVHMLPAITDIASHVPGAEIDWVVEESFAEIPAWHPAVNDVLTIAHRRWRKAWWSEGVRQERRQLRDRLRDREYDIVLDMQALLKSVWVVRQTTGTRHGLDFKSAREPLAALFYDVRHRVPFWQPAVVRQRDLAQQTFGYKTDSAPDFGLQKFVVPADARNYVAIMPSASRDDKLWPDEHWRTIFAQIRNRGLGLKLLAGNAQETARAVKLIEGIDGAEVLPRMGLTDIAHMLAGAKIMVGLDSGLTHLSAALGRPTIGIYRASTPVRTPLTGSSLNFSLGDRGASPSVGAVSSAVDQALAAADEA